MKITTEQFETMVEFMERNGDLSNPGRPQDWLENKWKDLINELYKNTSSEYVPNDTWKKVWSEIKTNTVTKAAEIHRGEIGTGGGQPSISALSDLELRVLNIVGDPSTGLNVPEVGLPKEEITDEWPPTVIDDIQPQNPPSRSGRIHTRSRQNFSRRRNRRRTMVRPSNMEVAARHFQDSGDRWRELLSMFARELLRQREQELQQRNQELRERRDWRVLFGKCLDLFENFIRQ